MKIEGNISYGGRNKGTSEFVSTSLTLNQDTLVQLMTKSTLMCIKSDVQPEPLEEPTSVDTLKSSTGKAGGQADTINVKFVLDSGHSFATAFKNTITIGEIRERLADVLDVDRKSIQLLNEKRKLSDTVKLRQLASQPYMTRIIRLESKTEETAIIEEKVRENIPSLDVITAHLHRNEEFQEKELVVEIENQCCQKEWLGGYRNKLSGVEYHNAITQTKRRERIVYDPSQSLSEPRLFHRDTQTIWPPKDQATATLVSSGTQMWRRDSYVPSTTDRILVPRHYRSSSVTSALTMALENKVITIQRAVRNWLTGKRILKVIKLEKKRNEEKKRQRLQFMMEQNIMEQQIITSAVYPSKRDDFYILYLMVEKWLNKDWNRIHIHRTEEARKSCRYISLQKQVKCLFDIEKHIIKVKKESLKKEDMRFLEMTSRPHTFKNSKGQVTSLDDRHTQRARAFKEVYSTLINKNSIPKDRISFLNTFKELFTSTYLNYEYSNDIVCLVNREIDLILIGTKDKDLKALRMRIEQLYLHFLRQEEFNPKAAKYKKPNWPKTVDKLYQCNRCKKLLPPSKFPVHIRMTAYTQCTSCEWIFNIGHYRVDMGPYLKLLRQHKQWKLPWSFILGRLLYINARATMGNSAFNTFLVLWIWIIPNLIQTSEMERCCYTSMCFLLQQIGMAHLTNVIWHGHSAISECADLTRLRHVRWLSDVEWAPWNTILLTTQEAKCHMSIPDVFQFYHKSFVDTIQQRHMKARITFTPLLKMDHYLRSGAWQSVNDSGPYFHPSHADMFASLNEYDTF